jgi:hypothetical protein
MRTVSEVGSLAVFELKGGKIMENRMVLVKSMVDAQLGITDPSFGIKRRW